MTGKTPLRYIPNSLTHILDEVESVREMSEAKNVAKVQLDAETCVVLGAPGSFWELVCERCPQPCSSLLGSEAKVSGLGDAKIIASWEAQREVEPWEEAPVVTLLLMVNQKDQTKVVERAEVHLFQSRHRAT